MYAIKHLYHIKFPRQKIFQELSTTSGLSHWWTVSTSGESNLGGVIDFRFGEHPGPKMKVTELKQNEKVVWECVEGPSDWVGTHISFALDENEGKTRIRFEHNGWKETGDHFAACSFSWARYLESLRQFCQTGKGEAYGSPGYRT